MTAMRRSRAMQHQQGIALITILVMVALASIIAASIAKRQQHTFENTAYLMRQNQALLYAKSAEAFFSELLIHDSDNAAAVDHLQETWAQPMPPFPVGDGIVSGQIEDQSGKFNLNSLVNAQGQVNEKNQKLFEALLKRVGLPEGLSQAVIDWQDADDLTVGAMGAESQYYQGLPAPHLAANRPLYHVEELRMLRGFEGANYDRIAPYVVALPDSMTKININTAPALVLASLDPSLDLNTVTALLVSKQQKLEHFTNVNALFEQAPFAHLNADAKARANELFDVKSEYFKANIEVQLSNRNRQLSSYLKRKDKQVYVYSRQLLPF